MLFFKKIIIFVFVFICVANAEETSSVDGPVSHPNCPKIDDINNPKLLAFVGDCSKYYSCLNGLAYPQKCPESFHFSRLASRCEYPENAMCPWQKQPVVIPTPSTAAIIPATENSASYISSSEIYYQLYPNDCNRYFKCEAMDCPRNYHWNSQQQKCDFPHIAQCPFRTTTLPTPVIIPTAPTAPPTAPPNAPPTEKPIVTPSVSATAETPSSPIACMECTHWCMGQGHIYLPYPGDCRKFIQCNGLAFIHNCPNDLLWNDREKTCDTFCIVNDK